MAAFKKCLKQQPHEFGVVQINHWVSDIKNGTKTTNQFWTNFFEYYFAVTDEALDEIIRLREELGFEAVNKPGKNTILIRSLDRGKWRFAEKLLEKRDEMELHLFSYKGCIHPFGCAEDEIYFALENPNTPKELINSLLELRGTIHPQSQLGYAAMAILRNDLPLAHQIMGIEEGEKEERKRKKQK